MNHKIQNQYVWNCNWNRSDVRVQSYSQFSQKKLLLAIRGWVHVSSYGYDGLISTYQDRSWIPEQKPRASPVILSPSVFVRDVNAYF